MRACERHTGKRISVDIPGFPWNRTKVVSSCLFFGVGIFFRAFKGTPKGTPPIRGSSKGHARLHFEGLKLLLAGRSRSTAEVATSESIRNSLSLSQVCHPDPKSSNSDVESHTNQARVRKQFVSFVRFHRTLSTSVLRKHTLGQHKGRFFPCKVIWNSRRGSPTRRFPEE